MLLLLLPTRRQDRLEERVTSPVRVEFRQKRIGASRSRRNRRNGESRHRTVLAHPVANRQQRSKNKHRVDREIVAAVEGGVAVAALLAAGTAATGRTIRS